MRAEQFLVCAHYGQPLPEDWHRQLATLLGVRPRRLSTWCELGLFGALCCLQQQFARTGTQALSSEIPIKVFTRFGTMAATHKAIAQLRDGLPMPFTFMQTQPGQLFNALGAALGWHGDGITTSAIQTSGGEALMLSSLQTTTLLGCVDEFPVPTSRWILLQPGQPEQACRWRQADSVFDIEEGTKWLRAGQGQTLLQSA